MVMEQGSFVNFPSRFDENLTQLKLTKRSRNYRTSDAITMPTTGFFVSCPRTDRCWEEERKETVFSGKICVEVRLGSGRGGAEMARGGLKKRGGSLRVWWQGDCAVSNGPVAVRFSEAGNGQILGGPVLRKTTEAQSM
jgi:hypothetical protein